MRLLLVMLAVALQAVISESFAQQRNTPYTVPDEHKDFVQQFNALLEKFPEAKKRFKLADVGNPDESREFVRQFDALLEKFPNTKKRFRPGDTGNLPVAQRVILWECTEFPPGSGFVDCVPKIQ